MVSSFVESKFGKFSTIVPEFQDNTYEDVVKRIVDKREDSEFYKLFAYQYDNFTARIANLSEELVSAVKIINEEFLIWLKTNPSSSQQIHSDAFEQLTGEILTSHGFEIKFTGRVKNRSADLIAIENKENEEVVKYLVECKRYSESRKIGINILNAVVGASFRAKVSHAMLVTTSSFTRNAFEARAELEDFRLDLHDGAQIADWLSDYDFKDFGLWLPEGWQDEWAVD